MKLGFATMITRRRMLTALLLPVFGQVKASSNVSMRLFVGNGGRSPKEFSHGHMLPLANWLGERSHIDFDVTPLPWPRAIAMTLLGEGAILGITRNSERERLLDFSQPVFSNKVWAIQRINDPNTIDGIASLQGKTVSVFRGASFGKEFEAARNHLFTVEEDPSQLSSRLEKLRQGRCDVLLLQHRFNDIERVRKTLALRGVDPTAFRLNPRPVMTDPVHFALTKSPENQRILARINDSIAAGNVSGDIERLVQRDYDHD